MPHNLAFACIQEEAHEDALWCACWIPGTNQLITGSVDETVKVWSVDTAKDEVEAKHTYTGHSLGVIAVAAHHSGRYAASSALDSFIRVWDLEDNVTKAVIETPPSETWQICFHPTSPELVIAAAGGSSSKVVLWDAEHAEAKGHLGLPMADDKVRRDKFTLSVAISPDGRRLACGAMDGTVNVFDYQTGNHLHALSGHHRPVRGLAFTPDSKLLLTACDDMQSHLYDVENATTIDTFTGHESWVLTVACHPDGTAFCTGSSDAKVKVWDIGARACVHTILRHTDQVWGVAWQDNGSQVASVSDDKNICFFKTFDPEQKKAEEEGRRAEEAAGKAAS